MNIEEEVSNSEEEDYKHKDITLINTLTQQQIKFIADKIDEFFWKKNRKITDSKRMLKALEKYQVLPSKCKNPEKYLKKMINNVVDNYNVFTNDNKLSIAMSTFFNCFALAVYDAKFRRDDRLVPQDSSDNVCVDLANIFRDFMFFAENVTAKINTKNDMRSHNNAFIDATQHQISRTIDVIHMDNYCAWKESYEQSSVRYRTLDEHLEYSCENILHIAKHKEEILNDGKSNDEKKIVNILISLPGVFGGPPDGGDKNPTSEKITEKLVRKYQSLISNAWPKNKYKNIKISFICNPQLGRSTIDGKGKVTKNPKEIRTIVNEKQVAEMIQNMNDEDKKHFDIFDYTKKDGFPSNDKNNKVHTIYCHPGDVKMWFGNENTSSFLYEKNSFDTTSSSAEFFFRFTDFISYVIPDNQKGDFNSTYHDYRVKNVQYARDFQQKEDIRFLSQNGTSVLNASGTPFYVTLASTEYNLNSIDKEKDNNKDNNVSEDDSKINNTSEDDSQITKCNQLKDPNGKELTTILTLAKQKENDGKFFEKKDKHWSWWVFPSNTGNESYKQFNFNDNSPIYKDIANNEEYLKAYTEVLQHITDELFQPGINKINSLKHQDFPKAFTCYNRILLALFEQRKTKELSQVQRDFIIQMFYFSLALTNIQSSSLIKPADIVVYFQKLYPKFATENTTTLNNIMNIITQMNENEMHSIITDMLIPKGKKIIYTIDKNTASTEFDTNAGNSCYFHTAISMLGYYPCFIEAMEDYLHNDDSDASKDKDEAKKFIKNIYTYLKGSEDKNTRQQCFKEAYFQYTGDNTSQQDATEAIVNIMSYLNKHFRIKIFDIFSKMIILNTITAPDGKNQCKTLRHEMFLNLFNIKDKNINESVEAYLKQKDIEDETTINGVTYKNGAKEKKTISSPPAVLFTNANYKMVADKATKVTPYNKTIFNKPNSKENPQINNEEFVPFACAEHSGTMVGGHWWSYGNSINNIKNGYNIEENNDGLANAGKKNNPIISAPNAIFLYNKNLYSDNKLQHDISEDLKKRLSKMSKKEMIIFMISVLTDKCEQPKLGFQQKKEQKPNNIFFYSQIKTNTGNIAPPPYAKPFINKPSNDATNSITTAINNIFSGNHTTPNTNLINPQGSNQNININSIDTTNIKHNVTKPDNKKFNISINKDDKTNKITTDNNSTTKNTTKIDKNNNTSNINKLITTPLNNNKENNDENDEETEQTNDKKTNTLTLVGTTSIFIGSGSIVVGIALREQEAVLLSCCAAGSILVVIGIGVIIFDKKKDINPETPVQNLQHISHQYNYQNIP